MYASTIFPMTNGATSSAMLPEAPLEKFTAAVSMMGSTTSSTSMMGGASSDELVVYYVTLVNTTFLSPTVSIFGILASAVNLVVFRRLGLRETINMTLFAVAPFDLISLVAAIWRSICVSPLFLASASDLQSLPLDIEVLTGVVPHAIATNASIWLIAFVTLERCLCLTVPLPIKAIITPGRTKIVIGFIFLASVVLQVPVFWAFRLAWKLDPITNRTVLGVEVLPEKRQMMDRVTLAAINAFLRFLTLVIVVVCSNVLVVKLSRSLKWCVSARARARARPRRDREHETMSSEDLKVMRMVLAIVALFMVTFIPSVLVLGIRRADAEFSATGRKASYFFVVISVNFLIGNLNASLNIFIYYNLSSMFKGCFRHIFSKGSRNDRNRWEGGKKK